MTRVILAVVAVFLAWSVMDFVIHGVILAPSYAATPALWRPMNEMKTSLLYISVLVGSSPQEMDKFLKGEIDRWAKVVKDNKIKAGD